MKSYISPTSDPNLSRIITEISPWDFSMESEFGSHLMDKAIGQITGLLVEEFAAKYKDQILASINQEKIIERVKTEVVNQIVKEAAKIVGGKEEKKPAIKDDPTAFYNNHY